MINARLAERGNGSCATLVTPVLLILCEVGVFWPQQSWNPHKAA